MLEYTVGIGIRVCNHYCYYCVHLVLFSLKLFTVFQIKGEKNFLCSVYSCLLFAVVIFFFFVFFRVSTSFFTHHMVYYYVLLLNMFAYHRMFCCVKKFSFWHTLSILLHNLQYFFHFLSICLAFLHEVVGFCLIKIHYVTHFSLLITTHFGHKKKFRNFVKSDVPSLARRKIIEINNGISYRYKALHFILNVRCFQSALNYFPLVNRLFYICNFNLLFHFPLFDYLKLHLKTLKICFDFHSIQKFYLFNQQWHTKK